MFGQVNATAQWPSQTTRSQLGRSSMELSIQNCDSVIAPKEVDWERTLARGPFRFRSEYVLRSHVVLDESDAGRPLDRE